MTNPAHIAQHFRETPHGEAWHCHSIEDVPALLRIEKLWDRNATLTTCLVDTFNTPVGPVTHCLAMDDIITAYDPFCNAAKHSAAEVVLKHAGMDEN